MLPPPLALVAGTVNGVAGTVNGVAGRLREWPVSSQQVARRNAMVACTHLAARRIEREEVEDFLTARFGPPASRTSARPAPAVTALG